MDTKAITQTAAGTAKPECDPHYRLLLKVMEATTEALWMVFCDKAVDDAIYAATKLSASLAKSAVEQWESTHGIPQCDLPATGTDNACPIESRA